MNVLYLPIDERQSNYSFPSIFFTNYGNVELNVVPREYMGRMKMPGDIDCIFSYLEKTLPLCDVAVLSLEMLLYGGYLPSRVHKITSEQLQDRLKALESLLRSNKCKNSKIYLFTNLMMTTQYSSSESDCTYYSNYGEWIFKRAYLLDKSKHIDLTDIEEQKLENCIKMIPSLIIKDYEKRVISHRQLILNCIKSLKTDSIEFLAINMEKDIKYGYESIAKREIDCYIKQNNLDDKVINYSKKDDVGFVLICRAILDFARNKIKVSVFVDCNNRLLQKERIKFRSLIELAGAIYEESIDDCDLILFVHSTKYIDCHMMDKSYNELIKFDVPFLISDEVFDYKSDCLFVRAMFSNGVNDNLLSYSGSSTIEALASGIIQYQYGTKKTRDNALFVAMLYEYAFDSCVSDKYINILKNKRVGNLVHINDCDIQLSENIILDIEFELHRLYGIIPHEIKRIIFPWYRLDEITIDWK